MNLPKRWIETESGSTPLERALLRPALQVDVPEDAEQQIWATIVALVPLSAAGAAAFGGGAAAAEGSAAAAASAGTAGAATTAASAGATTAGAATTAAGASATTAVASVGTKLGIGLIVKAFAIGAASGTLLVGGLNTIEPGRSSHHEARPAPGTATSIAGNESRAPSTSSPSPVPGAPTDPAARSAAPSARYPELPSRDRASTDSPTEAPSVVAFPPLPSSTAPVGNDPASKEPISRLGEEARVLRRAREALRHGNLGAAFAALEVARSEFPRGALGEEREALTIELLARSGQREAARARAAAFLRRFPGSAYAANVQKFAD